jgi:hypothetical protein
MSDLGERLFRILGHPDFLAMKGLANELPIFIQAYDPAQEDNIRRMVHSLTSRLRSAGIGVTTVDLFELVLEELEEQDLLDDLIENEPDADRADMLETLQNVADPKKYLIPRLIAAIGDGDTQLSLVTGSGRVYPFLRTHNILQSLEPAIVDHPVVIFFPGQYTQDPDEGSHLRLFGTGPGTTLVTPHYRARNLDDYTL